MPYSLKANRLLASKRWRKRNPDKMRAYKLAEYQRNKKTYRERYKRKFSSVRIECIAFYSKGLNCCNCCLEKNIEFLAIDHINGGGSKHRKEIRKRYPSMYHYLKANGYPEGYQILCHNCNLSLGFYGYCPHRRIVKK